MCRLLVKKDRRIRFCVTYTTRAPRRGEKNSRDYHFISRKEFVSAIKKGMFLEWAQVHGNLYGTSLRFAERTVKAGNNPLMAIDVQGAAAVKRLFPGSLSIFLLPPDWKDLRLRLLKRRESPENIRLRLETAKKELKCMGQYDYVVINDKVERAVSSVLAIISAERLKTGRMLLYLKKHWKIKNQ